MAEDIFERVNRDQVARDEAADDVSAQDERYAIRVDLLNVDLVREIVMLLYEALPHVPADSPLVARIADTLARADNKVNGV
jgi:hypothetical protein